jgi:hypothetical protein
LAHSPFSSKPPGQLQLPSDVSNEPPLLKQSMAAMQENVSEPIVAETWLFVQAVLQALNTSWTEVPSQGSAPF